MTLSYKENELNKGRKNDLRMYFSLLSKEPNEHDNSKYVLNVRSYYYNF